MKDRTISIAVASGKGGTGKTFVATTLFAVLTERFSHRVELVDCDVEEPNDLLFFPAMQKSASAGAYKRVPVIDPSACTYCRKCVEYCAFNAIVVIPSAEFAQVNKELCHACGACQVACRDNAITETDEWIGNINTFSENPPSRLTEGRLRIGSSMQTMLINKLKKHLAEGMQFRVYDAPPGTSCPVVETISDANYVVLVAEPTPFGLHDLKLMINLLNETNKPHGVIINKAGTGDRKIYDFLEEKHITLLGEIPFSRKIAEAYAGGKLPIRDQGAIGQHIVNMAKAIRDKAVESQNKTMAAKR